MAGIPRVTALGERTYHAVELIVGGQVVEGRPGGIGVAAAGSTSVLGVAAGDAQPGTPTGAATPTIDATGHATLLAVALPEVVTVYSSGREVPVVFAAPATNGQALIAAANGQVTPAGAGAAAATIIGRCVQPNGVATAGATGLMRTL